MEPYDGIRDRFSSSKGGESDSGGGSSRDASTKTAGTRGRSQMLLREGIAAGWCSGKRHCGGLFVIVDVILVVLVDFVSQ